MARMPKFGGKRQFPYAVLSLATRSMIGVWTFSENKAAAICEENDSPRQHSSKNSQRNNDRPSATTYKRPEIWIDTIRGLSNPVIAPCLCEKHRTQEPDNDHDTFNHNRPQQQPQSVHTKAKIALLRKHRTLRLLDEFKTQASVDSKYDWNKDEMVGEGAYSKVYKAISKDTGEVFALKKISKSHTDSQYFQQEVEAMLYIQEMGGHRKLRAVPPFSFDSLYIILLLLYQLLVPIVRNTTPSGTNERSVAIRDRLCLCCSFLFCFLQFQKRV